jgi:hypothetical protein
MVHDIVEEDCSILDIDSCDEAIVSIDRAREESSHTPREFMGSEHLGVDILLE